VLKADEIIIKSNRESIRASKVIILNNWLFIAKCFFS